MLLRPATLADVPAIADIYDDAVRTGTASFELDPPGVGEMTRRFDALMAGDYPYLVAVDTDETLLGYAYAGAFRPRIAYRFTVENSIYVAPGAQRRGVGKALLTTLVRECEARGFRQMVAVIGDSANAGSIGVHRACGFRDVGIIKGSGLKFGRWLDTVLMQRDLGPGESTIPEA
ncbi:phosphinothricin acetyltransferase [Azorhizobium sp. AG788]|uniref:GNAT family N-acetyltransferase n=1 Tax=Azorhizobium sp. AG788 TaxID=2183897 RepID=UPI001060FD3C|nr:GNAT family N-acetyltransferase [Azorhizobium sp. AG788]TDT92842.1 phosphinothricin acetyltransferase [Azorhizobium sp. AG788]